MTQVKGHMKHYPLHHVTYDLQSLKLLWPMVKETHLQENTLVDFWPWPQCLDVQGHTKCVSSTLYINCDLCTSIVWNCYIPRLKRRCIYKKIHYLTLTLLDLGVKVTGNVAQYPLHHVTYAPTKFEGATSKGLGRVAFTIKYIIWPWPS